MRALLLSTFMLLVAQQSTTGRVEISVRDASTREVLPGVPVTLTFKFPTEPAGPSTSLVTDPRGLAVFSGLATGNYIIKLGDGFKPLPFTEYVWIDAGDQKRVDVAVNRIATVRVRVLDQNGAPLRNALVTMPSITYVNGRRVLREAPGITHNDGEDGNYHLTGVQQGEHYLRIQHQVTRNNGQERPPLDAFYPGVTNFSDALRVTVRGGDLDLGEVRLPLQKAFKVSGVIVFPRHTSLFGPSRLTSFTVGLADAGSFLPPIEHRAQYAATADPYEVSFQLDGLPPATYALYPVFRAPETFIDRTVVTIKDQDIQGLRIVLKQPLTREASVTVNGENLRLRGPLSLGLVSKDALPDTSGGPPIRPDAPAAVFHAPDPQTGKFNLRGMIEGLRYGVVVSGLPADAYIADVRSGGRSILSEGSFVAAPGQGPLEIQIGAEGGVVQGLVRDSTSQAVASATVVVVPEFAKRGNSFLYKRATTDSAGRFKVGGIAPGYYQLFAWPAPPSQGAEEDSLFLAPFETRGTTARANSGVATEVSLRVIQ